MQNKYELKITELKAKYNKDEISYDSKDYVEDTTNLIFGQERGISAFMFGLDIEKKGYNIYIEGPTGVRKNEIY
jgi:peptidase S16 lon domain protein